MLRQRRRPADSTDAHAVLGHIAADGFGSEDLDIAADRARDDIERDIALPLKWSVERAAAGTGALQRRIWPRWYALVTRWRGFDPRDFSLVAFGGAGPLHAAEIAREVGVPRVIVPPVPGLFSAIGTMMAHVRHDGADLS